MDLAPLLADWPVPRAAAGVANRDAVLALAGPTDVPTPIASVTKLVVALAALVALEEGSIDLDEPAGPPGATVRHLLAHAAGLDFDRHVSVSRVGSRRVYSNAGIEQFAAHLEARTGIAIGTYLREAVLDPLGMDHSALEGSPAHGLQSTVEDLLRLGREFLGPTLIAPETLTTATTAQFPDLAGLIPGIGRFDPNPWGLGIELRDAKSPHWTGTRNSPATFGHFGGAGTFLWVDPVAGLTTAVTTGRSFGPWALEVWPPFSDAILAHPT